MTTLTLVQRATDVVTTQLTKTCATHNHFAPVTADEIEQAYAIATDLIDLPLAPSDEIARVHAHSRSTIWCVVDDTFQIQGFSYLLLLTSAGHQRLYDGTFTPRDIDLNWIAAPDQPVAAGYCWCYGATTKWARRHVVACSMAVRNQVLTDVPVYARGATLAGRIAMRRYGFAPLDHQPDLYVSTPQSAAPLEHVAA